MGSDNGFPTCTYCGFDDHPLVFAEHDCPDSMGYDVASKVQTVTRRRLIVPPLAAPPAAAEGQRNGLEPCDCPCHDELHLCLQCCADRTKTLTLTDEVVDAACIAYIAEGLAETFGGEAPPLYFSMTSESNKRHVGTSMRAAMRAALKSTGLFEASS